MKLLVAAIFVASFPLSVLADMGGPTNGSPTTRPAAAVAVLRTEDFESGAMRLEQTMPGQLEDFLRDLNRRKDFDFAAHGGLAGPNADYLANWVTRVTNELIARGYACTTAGGMVDSHGKVVAVR